MANREVVWSQHLQVDCGLLSFYTLADATEVVFFKNTGELLFRLPGQMDWLCAEDVASQNLYLYLSLCDSIREFENWPSHGPWITVLAGTD